MRGGNAQDRRRGRRAAERRIAGKATQQASTVTDDDAAAFTALVAAAQGGGFPLGERDEAWDSGAAEKSYELPRDGNHYFWKDPDGDPAAKSSYKLPFVSGDHAVWKAITAVAAALQGGRGGVDLPDADKAAIRSKVAGYYAKARAAYDDEKITVPWADGESAAEADEFGGKPNQGTPKDKRLRENDAKAKEAAAKKPDDDEEDEPKADPEPSEPDEPVSHLEAETPEETALAAFEQQLPALYAAVGDVAWGPEEGFVDLIADLNEVLGSGPEEAGEGAMSMSFDRVVDVSVRLDKALVCCGGDYYVAPISIDKTGEPSIGDRGGWVPVEEGWVETAPDADEPDATTASAGQIRFVLQHLTLAENGSVTPIAVGDLSAFGELSTVDEFADAVALPDAHKPGQRIPKRNPSPKEPMPPETPLSDGSVAWEAMFLPEGKLTDDGRAFAPESITWRDLPLSLMAMTETSAQGGHDGAEIAGRIDRIWRDGNMIRAAGVFDKGEYGQEIARMVADGTLRGLSVDTAIHEYEVGPRSDYFTEDGDWIAKTETAEEEGEKEEPNMLDLLFGGEDADAIFVVTKAVIGMATVCPFPAFADASISLAASGAVWSYNHQAGFIVVKQPEAALVAALETGDTGEAEDPVEALTAAAAGLAPVKPPADWFTDPALEELTPLTVTDDGRIFGHAWSWDTCHLSFSDRCQLAPHSQADNAYFHLGEIECEGGETLAVGKITLDTGHAGPRASRTQATSHYDDTGTVAAHVRCGEDRFGGWISGAINPELSEEKVRILRGAAVSGDWRAVRGSDGSSHLELVALLAVNVPGFPVPRQPKALVASHEGVQEPLALVAAGIVTETMTAEDLGLDALQEIADLAASVDCGCTGTQSE